MDVMDRNSSSYNVILQDVEKKGLESSTKKLLKDAKKYEEVILDVRRCEKKTTMDLSNSLLCHDDEKLRTLVEEWHSFISEANAPDEDLVLITRRTVVEPLKKFQGVFSETRSALKKREQAQKDCIKVRQKIQKLQESEKTGPNLVKLESAKNNLVNLEEEFKKQDGLLKTELPRLYEGKLEYFQPCLEALIKAQVEHSISTARIFNDTIPSMKEDTTTLHELNEAQKKRFTYIQSLLLLQDK